MTDTRKSILVVDDNPTNLKMILEILKNDYKIYPAPSGERALAFLAHTLPDLILLDVEMPDMNGYDVMKAIKAHSPWACVPVIFLTAQESLHGEEQALSMGAVDYILKPISAGVLTRRVQIHVELETYRKNLELAVEQKTEQLQRTQDAILDILANVTAFRDNETGAHILRTTEYVRLIVETLQHSGLPNYQLDSLYAKHIIKAAKLHDIGKVAIADSVLLKPDRLTSSEFERIKSHTTFGAMMIDNAMWNLGDDSAFLKTARELVLSHHECWDGSGYPDGLAREDIPLAGRIMAIADVYDALVSHRPYKRAFTHENAMFIIQKESGTHFDKTIIELCQSAFHRFSDIVSAISDDDFLNEFKAW